MILHTELVFESSQPMEHCLLIANPSVLTVLVNDAAREPYLQ